MVNKENNGNNKDNSFLYSASLVFDDNIDKLWLYFRDLKYQALNINYLDNFKCIKGDNSWTNNNICSLYWIGVSNFQMKCICSEVDRMRKMIKWKIKLDIGMEFYKTLCLYRITQNGKTLVKTIFTRTNKSNNSVDFNQSEYYINLERNNLLQHYNYLKNIEKDIISYGSCIINENFLKIWNILSNYKKLSKFAPFLTKNLDIYGPCNEIGSFIKFFIDELKKTVFLKVTKYIIPLKKKTYIYTLESIGVDNVNIEKKLEFKLTIINDSKSQLSIFHSFSYDSNPDYLKKFEIKKKKILLNFKNHLYENKDD